MIEYQAVQVGFFGDDDRTFAKEQSRKRAPKPVLPAALPDGPCCGRCGHWRRPESVGGFGECAITCVVTGRLYGAVESSANGSALTVDEAVSDPGIEWEPLRTKGFAEGCRWYRDEEVAV